ncbi:hypothetical protein SLS55_003328 [Diplodia seriata]|uniref:Acetylesterase n=1 Tax=Diplodia seriata TaxID=420778 RepID=A0ABR3CMN8_9PEZI
MTRISALIAAALSASGAQAFPAPRQANASWPGFGGLQYWFSFGDSYTQTGFDVNSTQPSAENPFGNPEYPGPNWVGYLTYKYNSSLLQTYNLASGGATVDSALVAPYADTVLSLKQQVEDEYLPKYGADGTSKVWESDNTLFSIWIGVNDVGNSYWSTNTTFMDSIFTEYSGLVDQLYTSGARNFLFLNVPPLERTPLTTGQGSDSVDLEKPVVTDFNTRISNLASSLQEKHADTTVFTFDAHTLFNQILDDPSSYTQTAGLKNTTAYCTDYENGTDEQNTTVAACGVAVNEYFWLNTLHPTFPWLRQCTAVDQDTFFAEEDEGRRKVEGIDSLVQAIEQIESSRQNTINKFLRWSELDGPVYGMHSTCMTIAERARRRRFFGGTYPEPSTNSVMQHFYVSLKRLHYRIASQSHSVRWEHGYYGAARFWRNFWGQERGWEVVEDVEQIEEDELHDCHVPLSDDEEIYAAMWIMQVAQPEKFDEYRIRRSLELYGDLSEVLESRPPRMMCRL